MFKLNMDEVIDNVISPSNEYKHIIKDAIESYRAERNSMDNRE
jgi:hypothetical protein